jgi:hypothetical protein
MENKPKLPALIDLYNEVDIAKFNKSDAFNYLVNQQPKETWVQTNKYANNSKYIPIGIIETLLQKLTKQFRIEVLREGTMFNAVYCVVRVNYIDITSGEWTFHDGVGAVQLQVKAGTSPADMSNINNAAVMMALPMAKSFAIKDACEHIGKLFGRDLNRKDVIEYKLDSPLDIDKQNVIKERKRIVEHIAQITDLNDLELFSAMCTGFDVAVELEEKRKQLTKTK